MTGDAGNDKLTVELGAVAHHAGCRKRIHWDQAHCARGDGVYYPIGQYLRFNRIGQDVM